MVRRSVARAGESVRYVPKATTFSGLRRPAGEQPGGKLNSKTSMALTIESSFVIINDNYVD